MEKFGTCVYHTQGVNKNYSSTLIIASRDIGGISPLIMDIAIKWRDSPLIMQGDLISSDTKRESP